METLPPEIIPKICQDLTPQDLARCCAVSHEYREIFDDDSLWKPHCDPELEESLRTTPSVVDPVFVSPASGNSTLTTISKWRLAFIRENHLWRNWKQENYSTQILETHSGRESALKLLFLSNTLLVNCYSNLLQIWDVSEAPATLVLESDPSVDIERWFECIVLDSNTLLVATPNSAKVFHVDVVNKSIKLKYEIPQLVRNYCTKEITVNGKMLTLGVSSFGSTLAVFDFGQGETIVRQKVGNDDGDSFISGISASPTSDDVLIGLKKNHNISFYIYNMKQQLLLPGPIAQGQSKWWMYGTNVIYKHYVALGELPSLTILDYHTSEVIFENKDQESLIFPIKAYKDSFIFVDNRDGRFWLKVFSLKSKTVTTEMEFGPKDDFIFNIVNNRPITWYIDITEGNRKAADPEKAVDAVSLNYTTIINSALTRGAARTDFGCVEQSVISYYYW